MDLMSSAMGMIRVEIVSANTAGALENLNKVGIPVFDVKALDELRVALSIDRKDYAKVQSVCRKRGEKLILRKKIGIYWIFRELLRRPLLMAGLVFLLTAGALVPSRILFVQVEGNQTIPDNRILAAAQDLGLGFGTIRRQIRSERIKNALLEEIPQLQWVGVNTRGCVAVIQVRERSEVEYREQMPAVSSIVAASDGIVLSATATSGNLLCVPGQAVTAGEVLISGYTDCGICIQATRAQGEVYARTKHTLSVIAPSVRLQRRVCTEKRVRYSLIFGKKRINLWKGSGISGAVCGRMYEVYNFTLPGGLKLPVVLIKETLSFWETEETFCQETALQTAVESYAGTYLKSQMIAGTVDSQFIRIRWAENTCCLEGTFHCVEMIGRQKTEQIGEEHE